jgi:hypothetical protein
MGDFGEDHARDGVIGTTGRWESRMIGNDNLKGRVPLVSLLLLFQTSKFKDLPSCCSTIFSKAEASILLRGRESPWKPTTKSKKGSMLVSEAGLDGVTRNTWRASDGEVDWPAPIVVDDNQLWHVPVLEILLPRARVRSSLLRLVVSCGMRSVLAYVVAIPSHPSAPS